jgi:lipopolysaccharide transport system ATP-binding protein
MSPAIRVEDVSKRYRVHHEQRGRAAYRTLREDLVRVCTAPFRRLRQLWHTPPANGNGAVDEDFWALRDVSFEVQPGEAVGIIGRNGAGKSTLLKILSRITSPTSGRATLHGRVGSLLEVGTGFHPELTGRENIFLNGAILGMTGREIQRKFDEIVEFSGVEQFLDTPVKHFSSGMRVRLAFSVAAHLEPEIVVVDEVLAVGDLAFQQKCLGKMNEVSHSGRTVLFVSHNMAAVEGLCKRAVVLQSGRVYCDADSREAVQAYFRLVQEAHPTDGKRFFLNGSGTRRHGFEIKEVWITSEGHPCPAGFPAGAPLEIHLLCHATEVIVRPVLSVRVIGLGLGTVTKLHSERSGAELPEMVKGWFTVTCCTRDLLLAPGQYSLTVGASSGRLVLQLAHDAAHFTVLPTDFFGTGRTHEPGDGCVLCRQNWGFEPSSPLKKS